jgi:hypothetical protein
MDNIFQEHYRSTIAILIHDAGIQGYTSITVGKTAIANALIFWIGFRDLYTGFYCINSPACSIPRRLRWQLFKNPG